MARNKISIQPLELRVDELYKWYKSVKNYVAVWITVSEWFIMVVGASIIFIIGIKFYDVAIFIWPQISIDAKFGAAITLGIFAIGIFIGRLSKKVGKKEEE